MRLQDRVRDGYTPTTSLSRHETDILKEFFGSHADPSITIVMLRALDGGSMHRLPYINESIRLCNYLQQNLSIHMKVDDIDESFRYADICGPFCESNIPVSIFYDLVLSQVQNVKSGMKPSYQIKYPISYIYGFEIHFERNFFGVKFSDRRDFNAFGSRADHNLTRRLKRNFQDENLSFLNQVTNIDSIELIMLIFQADIFHPTDGQKMARWEMEVYEFKQSFNSSLIEMIVLGDRIVDYEMNKEAQNMAPHFALGFLLMFTFVVISLAAGLFYYGIADLRRIIFLSIGISLCPVFAITTTFGICTFLQWRTNSAMLITPFLICGIGVNDAFLITHSWNRLEQQGIDKYDRLASVFGEVGPSITITTLTNVITFTIGALTPTPEISLFCAASAMALGLAYIYTLILYGPIICYASDSSTQAKTRGNIVKIRQRLASLFGLFNIRYESFISNTFFHFILLGTYVIYWLFAWVGTMNMDAFLDAEMILPKSSPILEPHRLISHLVWTEYYPLTLIINNPLDIRSSRKLIRFNTMLQQFERMKFSKGKEYTICWLRDYSKYSEEFRHYEDLVGSFDEESNFTRPVDLEQVDSVDSETGLDYNLIEQFLSLPLYKHHKSFIKFYPSRQNQRINDVPIAKFMLQVTYFNTTSWQERIELMQEWRELALNYSDLNVTVWEINSMFVDQMLGLKSLTIRSSLITLFCMALVCVIFIQNPFPVVVAVAAIGSIFIGVIGYLSLWHLHLDPVTLCAVLMSIGMSVDFTAHFTYHFQQKEVRVGTSRDGCIRELSLCTSNEKLANALHSVAWPMFQAGLSTVICIIPLIFLQNYIPLVFVKTITLVVIWGLFHGLVLLPALFIVIPSKWLELNIFILLARKIRMHASTPEHLNDGVSKYSADTTKKEVHDVLLKMSIEVQN